MEKELLYEVTIPEYPRIVQISKSRRPKPVIKGKNDKKIHLLGIIKKEFEWRAEKNKGKIIEKLYYKDTNRLVPSNPKTIGTPKLERINGQKIYNQTYHHSTRDKIVHELQNYFMKFIDRQIDKQIEVFPLIIEGELFDTIVDNYMIRSPITEWDVDNRQLLYNKVFLDTLVGVKVVFGKKIVTKGRQVIKDDKVNYITGPPHLIFTPIDRTEDRKLVYRIYHDKRDVIKKYYGKK